LTIYDRETDWIIPTAFLQANVNVVASFEELPP
jgi:hypothetical protein